MNPVKLQITLPLLAIVLMSAPPAAADDAWKGSRLWLGPDWHAGPMQDWRIRDGVLHATPRGPQPRFAHMTTRELGEPRKGFTISSTVSLSGPGRGPKIPAAGIEIGVRGNPDNLLQAAVYPTKSFTAGLTASGGIAMGAEFADAGIAPGTPVKLTLTGKAAANGRIALELLAARTDGAEIARLETQADAEELRGAIGVFVAKKSNNALANPAPEEFAAFRGFSTAGEGMSERPENAFGPVLWTQYSYSGGLLRVQAQFPPLEADDSRTAALEWQSAAGTWEKAATARIEPVSSTALFEIRNWAATKSVPYRVSYDWQGGTHYWNGVIRREPAADKPWKLGLFSCDVGTLFPLAELIDEVRQRDPDILFFAGDQFYESHGGFGFVRNPVEIARLDYLRKWYLFGWTNRHILKDRPSIIIPDDHDVFQGNLWGHGGRELPGMTMPQRAGKDFGKGGYAMAPEWMNLAERTQTGHLPPPYDPTPIGQGIGVYYTAFAFGGVSFAVLEDRKFKIGPGSDEAKKGDQTLLGRRQIDFLNHWAQDWAGASMKVVLSQTIFAQPYTHGAGTLRRNVKVSDNNAWPVEGRNEALRAIRKSGAFSLHGDQHVAVQLRHGVDDWEDAGVAFMGPATVAGFPRAWWPEGAPQPGSPLTGDHRGRYFDDFGHRITVDAAANPLPADQHPQDDPVALAMAKASGYGIIDFDPAKRTMTTHCHPLPYPIDPARLDGGEYKGWPLTFPAAGNDGRKPAGFLPEQKFDGENPVVAVFDAASGELIYARRIVGKSYAAPVFKPGTYEIRLGKDRPETSLGKFTFPAK